MKCRGLETGFPAALNGLFAAREVCAHIPATE